AGTGTTTFNGSLNTNGASGIDLNGNAFSFNNAPVTTTGNGAVSITNSGALTIDANSDMSLDGAFLQDGTAAVTTSGDITTTNDNIIFTRAVTLGGSVLLSTGAGIG